MTVDSSDDESWDGVKHVLEGNNLKYFIVFGLRTTSSKKYTPNENSDFDNNENGTSHPMSATE
jgi:hypothetical protein